MTDGKTFSFIEKRIGLSYLSDEQLGSLIAASPFDFETQCRLFVPTFLPDPKARPKEHIEELSDLMAEVFRITEGRAMALFTSRAKLLQCADFLDKMLLGDDIRVLAQSRTGGSREAMTAEFKRGGRTALLGLDSFWEGVDIAGSALSCLIITALPFFVPTDPIVKARSDATEKEGQSAFNGYLLPSAVLRLRQGFGRLIRSKKDRGAAIITDTRIVTQRYGKSFSRALPSPMEVIPNKDEFLDAMREFFKA